jgi:hypothetical protein
MTSLKIARRAFVGAMSVVAVSAAACSTAPTRVVQGGVNPDPSRYSCYFADSNAADRVIGGRTFHWCGPVPRAVQ